LINTLIYDLGISSCFEVLQCSDGIELLDIIIKDKDNKIKLILIDENMEYLNGSETVKLIRKLEEKNKINKYYIVSISATDDIDNKIQIMKSGVNSIISKPCKKSDLNSIFKDILSYKLTTYAI
jgi:PleD family two-component response regulator